MEEKETKKKLNSGCLTQETYMLFTSYDHSPSTLNTLSALLLKKNKQPLLFPFSLLLSKLPPLSVQKVPNLFLSPPNSRPPTLLSSTSWLLIAILVTLNVAAAKDRTRWPNVGWSVILPIAWSWRATWSCIADQKLAEGRYMGKTIA